MCIRNGIIEELADILRYFNMKFSFVHVLTKMFHFSHQPSISWIFFLPFHFNNSVPGRFRSWLRLWTTFLCRQSIAMRSLFSSSLTLSHSWIQSFPDVSMYFVTLRSASKYFFRLLNSCITERSTSTSITFGVLPDVRRARWYFALQWPCLEDGYCLKDSVNLGSPSVAFGDSETKQDKISPAIKLSQVPP